MRLRTPLVATVIGALFIGGAVTGTTLALWHDQRNLSGSIPSGSTTLTVNGQTITATFIPIPVLALNDGSAAGTPKTFTATLVAGGTGKNLRMRMYVDDVSTTNSPLDAGLEIALSGAAKAQDCPAAATASYALLSGLNLKEITDSLAAGVAPGTSRVLCVAIRVRANAPAATSGKTGTLQFTFRGQQVRP